MRLDYISHYRGDIPDWLNEYSTNGVKTGSECCSAETITFHYTPAEQMNFFGNFKNQSYLKQIELFF